MTLLDPTLQPTDSDSDLRKHFFIKQFTLVWYIPVLYHFSWQRAKQVLWHYVFMWNEINTLNFNIELENFPESQYYLLIFLKEFLLKKCKWILTEGHHQVTWCNRTVRSGSTRVIRLWLVTSYILVKSIWLGPFGPIRKWM